MIYSIRSFRRTYRIDEKCIDTLKYHERYTVTPSPICHPNIITNERGEVVNVVIDITKVVIETLTGQQIEDGQIIDRQTVSAIVPINRLNALHEDVKAFWDNEIKKGDNQ